MKVFFSLVVSIFSGLLLFGQLQTSGPISKVVPTHVQVSYSNSQRTPVPEVSDTIWTDDFSNPGSWIVAGGTNDWTITDSLDSNLINQGFDTVIHSFSGGNFAFIDSDINGDTASQDAFLTLQNGVDCSSRSHVWLTFETYLAQFQETREIQVTTDNGMSWDTFLILTEFPPNSISPNTYSVQLDISDAAANESNVIIRFRYQGSWDWFWCVDDVALVVLPDYDLELNQVFYNGVLDPTYSIYYTSIPIKQAEKDTLNFGVTYSNKGVMEPSITLRAQVDFGGNPVFADSVFPGLAPSGETNEINFPNSYIPLSGLGLYTVSFDISSDSTDESPMDNIRVDSFTISLNEYRRDNDSVNSAFWPDVQDSWEMLVRYELFTEDTIEAISVYFPFDSLADRGVSAGDLISFYVYSASDLIQPLAVNEFYPVSLGQENSWITLSMGSEPVPAGNYFIGFKVYNDSASVGTNTLLNAQTPPLSVLIRKDAKDATDPWTTTTQTTPFIRMYTANEFVCDSANLEITSVVVDSVSPGRIEISVSGGTPPYRYVWTGDSNYYSTSKNAENILHQGVYTVVVSDLFGCSASKTDTVSGIVSVSQIQSLDFQIFPNPNDGQFFVVLKESGVFDLTVRNSLGKVVWIQKISSDENGRQRIEMAHLSTGIYFVEIGDENGNFKVSKIILF